MANILSTHVWCSHETLIHVYNVAVHMPSIWMNRWASAAKLQRSHKGTAVIWLQAMEPSATLALFSML